VLMEGSLVTVGQHLVVLSSAVCGSCVCADVAGILHEALNSVTTLEAVHMMNGVEGRRRRAAYSKCFTPSALHKYYAVYNQVVHVISSTISSVLIKRN